MGVTHPIVSHSLNLFCLQLIDLCLSGWLELNNWNLITAMTNISALFQPSPGFFSSILSILDILETVVERVCYEKILLEKQTNVFCSSSGNYFK